MVAKSACRGRAALVTIAMCYLSPEGVVLGADSTASAPIFPAPNMVGFHFLNHNQKLFELGEESTLGVLTWNLGSLPGTSFRTMFAQLADDLKANPAADVAEVANRWVARFWPAYSAYGLVQQCVALHQKPPFDPNAAPPNPAARTQQEEQEYEGLKTVLLAGFCIGGYVYPSRTPMAYEILFEPVGAPPAPAALPIGDYRFWGAPNMIQRLINGYDGSLTDRILNSGQWTGTRQDLVALLDQLRLFHPLLPIRDAIDFVHACIQSTIKGIKFSHFFQVCGGPIELAVITSDRRFRWVMHKAWDAAMLEGQQP